MAKLNPIAFMQEVRQEVAKVTWPTRKEVSITTDGAHHGRAGLYFLFVGRSDFELDRTPRLGFWGLTDLRREGN